jgi:hypothetical protein
MPIPFLSIPDSPITAYTQDILPLVDIVDGIVIYKNGGAALILESSSLNFGLLSENEQEAVIASYAGLLNSLNFPVQIVVRSQKKDISKYMQYLEEVRQNIKIPKLSSIMDDYRQFVQEAIKKKNILSKKFYIAIPFTPYELGLAKSVSVTFFSTKNSTLPFPKSYVIRKAKISLLPKRDHLIRQAGRLQLKFRQLDTVELIRLFYDIFNPEPPIKEKENIF